MAFTQAAMTSANLLQRKHAFIFDAMAAAEQANHIFPEAAACEAAEESGYGSSSLARLDNNLFGMKQHRHPIYSDVRLPTREYLGSEWELVEADFIKYPSWSACMTDRMQTLVTLAPYYPNYKAALRATCALEYIVQVSQSWSTDPNRATAVIQIYKTFFREETL